MSAPEKMGSPVPIRFQRSLKLALTILVVVVGLWLIAHLSAISTRLSSSGDMSKHGPGGVITEHAEAHVDAPRKQVVVRTIPTNSAGLGSVVAQLRSSAAIATMLGASFSTFSVMSTHLTQYRAASLMKLDLLETELPKGSKVCSIASSLHEARTAELMRSWCDNVAHGEAYAQELQEMWSDCNLIIDDRPWDVRYDMSKCTWKWVKHVFTALGLKERPRRGIGLHIRWGDISIETLPPERSTPVDLAAQMIAKMRKCGVQDELSVYMEWHNDTMLSGLGEPYRIVDSGDSIDDLLDLAANRVLILDISSWTVLAHQIAEGGISLVPNVEGYDGYAIPWDDNGMNRVLRWNELLDISCNEFSSLLDF